MLPRWAVPWPRCGSRGLVLCGDNERGLFHFPTEFFFFFFFFGSGHAPMMNIDGYFMDHGETDTEQKNKQTDMRRLHWFSHSLWKSKRGNLYDTNKAMKWAMRRSEMLRFHTWALFIRCDKRTV